MQPSRKQRSRPKFSGSGWLPGQLHQQLYNHSSTTLSANPKRWEKEEENALRKIQDTISNDKTMAFFDPSRPIIPRTEASYNQGLSEAQLQKTDKGIQPAHFISPTMAETEKRYNQTEKDALAIKWAKEQRRVYRLGPPRFRIVATQKPLLPLFNKAKATMSPRIEKWVMEMQDVDYELVYEPRKDEADPLDYLSRHPLPETEDDSTEKTIRRTLNTEHAAVITRIREETLKDEVMQNIAKRIVKREWEKHKRDKGLREARVVNRGRTNFQRTAYSATSNSTEERSQARTQPWTLGQDQDQTAIERKILGSFDEQYD